MNHERRKERHPHLYKEVIVYNNLQYEVSDLNIEEIIDDLIEDNLINTTNDIITEVEINNEEKTIEIEINNEEKTVILEEIKEPKKEIKEPKKVVKKVIPTPTPVKKLDKKNIKTPLKKA